ncbi:MAG: SDR family NAD(P)-dependent oxidoreductase [Rhodobacteraceae bacterium]|nr:SDR family NAD(P)-dependent oxidoreductase [Paracoccaceae bacterium]
MTQPELIWIIGASDGIGAALARAWAGRGVRLVLSARSADKLTALARELGNGHVALPLDVADRGSLAAAADQIRQIGTPDRVVHLAAIYDPGQISDLDPEMAAKIVSVNLTGSFHVAQLAPQVLRAGGQLAMCGSSAGFTGLPQGQIYSATKAAVINLTESLRGELAGRIDVRLINPGFVETRLTGRNDFQMPFLISTEAAAEAIIKGLNGRRFEVHFPRRMTYLMKLLSALPYWALLPLTGRLAK